MKSVIVTVLKTIETLLCLARKQISENEENLIIEDISNTDDISFKLQQKLKDETIVVSFVSIKDDEAVVRIKY